MNTTNVFSETVTKKIWKQYLHRVNRCSKALGPEEQEELLLEIQDHLLESFKQETGESEAHRLLDAIAKIGEPEDFIKPIVADKLLVKASKTYNPKTIVTGLFYYLSISAKHFLLALLFSLGYVTAFIAGVMALLKPFFPNNVGLILYEGGDFVLGVDVDTTGAVGEVLGYWVIPIGLTAALLIYLGLTRLLSVLRKSKD